MNIDPSNPNLYLNDTWQQVFLYLREHDPIHFTENNEYGSFYSITKYEDIESIELDYTTFSSEAQLGGITIKDNDKNTALDMFIKMAPPRHTEYRKTLSPIFSNTNLKYLEEKTRARCNQILDNLPMYREFDWVTEVSVNLTSMMMAEIFQWSQDDRTKLVNWSDVFLTDLNDPHALVENEEERTAAYMNMHAAMKSLWDSRIKQTPANNFISLLSHNPSIQNIGFKEFLGTMTLLLVASNDTVRNSISGGVIALAENPIQYKLAKHNKHLIPNMVSEMIRWQTPIIHMRRTATKEVTLKNKIIPAGAKVILWYISANRDDAVVYNPDTFDITRVKHRKHLSFGSGIHRCMGDRLAEMQLRVLWETILDRDIRIEVIGKPTRLYSNFSRGIKNLPVIITKE